jgi:tRNA(His) guanylyltransferase
MACSRFEYVKDFERDDSLLPGTYVVVRLDGRGFTKFTTEHGYAKPNDVRGLGLMNQCAAEVMRDWGDAVLAFGESDEYSFVFPRRAAVFGRRAAKLATGIASQFAAAFVFYWPDFFHGVRLARPPSFDARCVVYPTLATICDYARWRQVDAHVNALHNEAFWALVALGAW